MKIKEGVIMAGLQLPMRRALLTADKVYSSEGEELVITGALDGEHSAGSLHYYGYAVDIRNRFFDKEQKERVFQSIKKILNPYYDVINHSAHIHIEYQKALD